VLWISVEDPLVDPPIAELDDLEFELSFAEADDGLVEERLDVELACDDEVALGVVELEGIGEEFWDGVVLAGVDCRDELLGGATSTELGDCPAKNWMLCPVFCGSEHMLERVFVSLKATVADATSVQLQ
jgi:hypothetical protein